MVPTIIRSIIIIVTGPKLPSNISQESVREF